MAIHNLLLLPGDGIGPEVMAEVKRVIDFFNKKGPDKFTTEEALVGGCCYDAHGVAVTDETVAKAKGRRCGHVRFGRRAEVGQGCPMRCGRKRACCGCARTSISTPTCARR